MFDYFTKWCEAVPLQRQDANSEAQALIDNWIARFGAPHSLPSDQGAAFESQLLHHICNVFGVRKTRTTAYHPEGNGLVERTNLDRLSTNAWDETLPQCLLAYLSSMHSSTGFSPALLLYGQELRLPIEDQFPSLLFEKIDHIAYVRQLRNRSAIAYDLASTQQKFSSYH
ncbi:unnamed protein product [Trichobilharzia regenti]|nr:unnamed protein product [Trichobilharzia regenti]